LLAEDAENAPLLPAIVERHSRLLEFPLLSGEPGTREQGELQIGRSPSPPRRGAASHQETHEPEPLRRVHSRPQPESSVAAPEPFEHHPGNFRARPWRALAGRKLAAIRIARAEPCPFALIDQGDLRAAKREFIGSGSTGNAGADDDRM